MNKNGFSLIELLIGIGLLAAIGVSLTFNFRSGAELFNRSEKEAGAHNQNRLFLGYIENELVNMVSMDEVPFVGKANEMKFVSYGRVSDKNGKEVDQLIQVTYQARNRSMKRIAERIRIGDYRFEPKGKTSQYLVKDFGKIFFEYGYKDPEEELTWKDYWGGEEVEVQAGSFPAAIRIHMTFLGKDDSKETLIKTISIPDGVWQESLFSE